jgi:hypothetical protein
MLTINYLKNKIKNPNKNIIEVNAHITFTILIG